MTILSQEEPGFDAVWGRLRIPEPALAVDLGETITARSFTALRGAPSGPASSPTGAPAGAPRLGRMDADIEILGLLGEGSAGRVMLARQRSLNRNVAVKVLRPEADEATARGLLMEALVTGAIEHPNVVPIHALGGDERGHPVLVMKRIEGVAWKALVEDQEHPGWAKIAAGGEDRLVIHLEILMQVASAVHSAHTRGFVHRDLKLANVMIGETGEVYVVDWGLAVRMEEARAAPEDPGDSHALVGTPRYLAPEMLSGDPRRVDARTDVFLLGATLHTVLTGKPRHQGSSLFEVLASAHACEPFAFGDEVPAELGAICNKATSAAPEDRYTTALELRQAIAGHLRHRGSIALSDAAAAQLAEVQAGSAEGQAEARLTECRFGFMQALRAWPENARARAGLQACLERMIEDELVRRDTDGARALCGAAGPAAGAGAADPRHGGA